MSNSEKKNVHTYMRNNWSKCWEIIVIIKIEHKSELNREKKLINGMAYLLKLNSIWPRKLKIKSLNFWFEFRKFSTVENYLLGSQFTAFKYEIGYRFNTLMMKNFCIILLARASFVSFGLSSITMRCYINLNIYMHICIQLLL